MIVIRCDIKPSPQYQVWVTAWFLLYQRPQISLDLGIPVGHEVWVVGIDSIQFMSLLCLSLSNEQENGDAESTKYDETGNHYPYKAPQCQAFIVDSELGAGGL